MQPAWVDGWRALGLDPLSGRQSGEGLSTTGVAGASDQVSARHSAEGRYPLALPEASLHLPEASTRGPETSTRGPETATRGVVVGLGRGRGRNSTTVPPPGYSETPGSPRAS